MRYRLTWIDETGEKQLRIFEAKTERVAVNKTKKLLDGTKITDPFLCPDVEEMERWKSMNLTTEKPILFNTEMVQAILAGQKTSTRRVTKFKPYTSLNETNGDFEICEPITQNFFKCRDNFIRWAISKCRYKVGDILYVRETWRNQTIGKNKFEIQYKADFSKEELACYGRRGGYAPCKWHPSIHMPKTAARIFLKVTDVKVQQIQDITEDAAKAEGATPQIWYQPYGTKTEGEQRYIGDIVHQKINYVTGFAHIWDKTINKKEYAFQSNPWVWVIEFEKVKK